MTPPARNLIIAGDSLFAQVAYEYFTHDSRYRVAAFAVEREFRKRDQLCGLPVVDFETVKESHPPAEHALYAALVYTQMNRLRTRFVRAAKAMGYELASYVSSRALVWRNVSLGEHCFVFEGAILQPFATVGDNVVIWSGSHVGHHATIRDNCFIAPEVAISGSVEVGENSFVGINATLVNDIVVAP